MRNAGLTSVALLAALLVGCAAPGVPTPLPPRRSGLPLELQRWLEPQNWQRDTTGPVLELGSRGEFDDTHVFGPCVVRDQDRYQLWYCGSRGTVADRVFGLGLALSSDGLRFEKHSANPVLRFEHSVLTPTILRRTDGSPITKDGTLRMWFSSADLTNKGQHRLHSSTSPDGIQWSKPSPPQLDGVYAPTILEEGRHYRLWYTDVSGDKWVIRHALSLDGRRWRVTRQAVLRVDQKWERGNLFYPTVIKTDGVYLMWYGSYWSAHRAKTAIGFAASLDGIHWYKHPQNPVLRPDPARPFESHYTTSQSIVRAADGSFRIWYATRKKPPFRNKYFAIGTAAWRGPTAPLVGSAILDLARTDPRAFASWQFTARARLTRLLGIPGTRLALDVEHRGDARPMSGKLGDFVIQKLVFTSESGSRIPALLYRPQGLPGKLPGIVLTYGHGGSKSQPAYQYLAQLYAQCGIVCLAIDPIGEEERHHQGRLGTRAHDPESVHRRAWDAGRPIMGKLVWDAMRGVDLLLSRSDIDPARIGVAGNSLGGAIAGWMAVLDTRLRFAIVSGWAFDDLTLRSKFCTRVPNQRMREMLTWDEYLALAAPHCAVLVMNGDADVIIDRDGTGEAWRGTRDAVSKAARVFAALSGHGRLVSWFESGGGHRPYPAHRRALGWLVRHAGLVGLTSARVERFPVANFGEWADRFGIRFERLYGTRLHLRGASVADVGVKYLAIKELAVLKESERGKPDFSLRGWLEQIEGSKR